MKNRETTLREFAKLVVRAGGNVQKGQTVIIQADINVAEMVRLVAEECWLAGAGVVHTFYADEPCTRMRYQYGEVERLSQVPQWMLDRMVDYPKSEACYLYIHGDNPDLLAGLPAEKIGKISNAQRKFMKPFRDMMDRNENQWCIVAVPTPAWAAKVFPDLPVAEAMEKLWDAILITMRLDLPDPIAAWEQHRTALARHCQTLTESGICRLEFKSGLGTDLSLELAEHCRWSGGGDIRADGIPYFPNMPTEEVFSMPHRNRVNGRVVASMPLSYQGSLIENFSLTFQDGKVVDFTAEKGLETLAQIMDADEGAKHLGEVALVPYSSPIRRSGILFYSTLFDENAACHLALGSAYPDTMEGYFDLTKEERAARGYNESVTHVDFMFGTADLSVVGVTADGRRIPVFEKGEFVI